MPYYPPSFFGDQDPSGYSGPDNTNFGTFMARDLPGAYTGGPGGVSMENSGQDYIPDQANAGGPNFAGMASGLGSVLALGFQLAGQAKQRAMQKKIMKVQRALEAEQFKQKMLNSGIQEGTVLHGGDISKANLQGEMAGRGLADSSINQQGEANRQYGEDLQLDAIRRQRALDKYGREAQLKIQKIQSQGERFLYYMQIGTQVANAVGQAAGAVAGAGLSDPKLKENRKPANTKSALQEITDTPVEKWNYKADKVNPRLGPMADKVQENSPDASDGHSVDMVTMNGKLMAAVQELSKEVQELKKRK